MKRIMHIFGMSIGGWVGWAAGDTVSLFTAFVVGVVGTGLGLYLVQRVTRGIP